jgi:hypothetical protein
MPHLAGGFVGANDFRQRPMLPLWKESIEPTLLA